ncbi:MAG TPA: LptE family protein [Candidatus Sulfopaludibacter sp.]|jgi:outer membrane lipopolysaccharide assembly protein LptE/RlpB|nr:LptE family protein [Candidatus Sulfopaludibacter sp.]
MRTLLVTALVALSACGYHVAGHADLMPKTIKTIAIPAFANPTTRYQIARMLPEDVAREFIARTRYKVVADPAQADAILAGVVNNYTAYPVVVDPTSGRATGVQVIVNLQITLTERATGKVLFQRNGFEFRDRYTISIDPQSYFDENGTAMSRVSKDAARSIVTGILENF